MLFRRKRLTYWTRDVQLPDGSWQRFEWRPTHAAIDKPDGALTTYGTLRHDAAKVLRDLMDGPLPSHDHKGHT